MAGWIRPRSVFRIATIPTIEISRAAMPNIILIPLPEPSMMTSNTLSFLSIAGSTILPKVSGMINLDIISAAGIKMNEALTRWPAIFGNASLRMIT